MEHQELSGTNSSCAYLGCDGLGIISKRIPQRALLVKSRQISIIDCSRVTSYINQEIFKKFLLISEVHTIVLPSKYQITRYIIENSSVTNIRGLNEIPEEIRNALRKKLCAKKNFYISLGNKLATLDLPKEIIQHIVGFVTKNDSALSTALYAANKTKPRLR